MRKIIILALLLVSGCRNEELRETTAEPWPWPVEGVAKVKFFLINSNSRTSYPGLVSEDGSLNESRIPKDGVILSSEQELVVREALLRERPPRSSFAMCFNPRHSFLLLDSSGDKLGVVDICFECGNFSGFEGIAKSIDFEVLAYAIKQLGYRVNFSEPRPPQLGDPGTLLPPMKSL